MGQCASLAHFNLADNRNGAEWAKRLAGVRGQCARLAHLNLAGNDIRFEGMVRLAGVLDNLVHILSYLGLRYNDIVDKSAGRLTGVLGQCASLADINLSEAYRNIGAEVASWLAGCWGNARLADIKFSDGGLGEGAG